MPAYADSEVGVAACSTTTGAALPHASPSASELRSSSIIQSQATTWAVCAVSTAPSLEPTALRVTASDSSEPRFSASQRAAGEGTKKA